VNERPWVSLERLEAVGQPPGPPRRRPRTWLLVVAWSVAGIVLVSQARLPDPPAVARQPPSGQVRRSCWVVQVEAADGPRAFLVRDLRRLRRAGLRRAALWQGSRWSGWRPKAHVLVVPAPNRQAAASTRARLARLGFPRAVAWRLPLAACRPRR
jgi:hypothetical protein